MQSVQVHVWYLSTRSSDGKPRSGGRQSLERNMILKLLAVVFATIAISAPILPDAAGNPGCRMVVGVFAGNMFAECVKHDCANPCTEDLAWLPGYPGVSYCPCGNWDDEQDNLNCLATMERPNWPALGGQFYACEAICLVGCEKLAEADLTFANQPVCSLCQ